MKSCDFNRKFSDNLFLHYHLIKAFQNLNPMCNESQQNACIHYKNRPMQYIAKKFRCKNENFHWKTFDIFLIFAKNIDCGYTLEPPHRGGSNEYPQSMFWSKNKKNRYTPANPSFSI